MDRATLSPRDRRALGAIAVQFFVNGAMTSGIRIACLITPAAVGALAGTGLSVGAAIAVYSLPAALGLVVVTEWNERLLRLRTPSASRC